LSALALALTFDDGPDPVWTGLVLDALADRGAHATFFVIAPLAAEHPELVARMRDEGHLVALHCAEHVRHDGMTEQEIAADTDTALATLADLGVHPTLWRTPWGRMTDATRAVAAERGLTLVHWTADTEDWTGHGPDAMLERAPAAAGAVILAHDGIGPGATRETCAHTVAYVGRVLDDARDRGLTATTLSPEAVPS